VVDAVAVLILLASPRGDRSQTQEGINELILEIERRGFRTKVIKTAELSFAACSGCGACEEQDDCVVQDDVQKLLQQMLEARGFVLASPVYLEAPTGRLKCLLDRFWPWILRPRLFGKYAGVVVTTGNFGGEAVARYLTAVLEAMGVRVVGSVIGRTMNPDRSSRRKRMLIDCRLLGRRLAEAIQTKKEIRISSQGKRFVTNLWKMIQANPDQFPRSLSYWKEEGVPERFGI